MHSVGNFSCKYEPSESGHEEEMCFIGSYVLGSRLDFQRSFKNQGWNIKSDWTDGMWMNQYVISHSEK